MDRRGWITKRWTTKKGDHRGGRPFTKNALYHLLTNPTYIGQVRYKTEVHAGEHEAIVENEVFERVQVMLARNGHNGGRSVRNKHGALLTGLVRCRHCECAMTHSYTSKGNRRYRYYVCTNAQKRGWKECPAPSIPAGELERFVVEQIETIGADPAILAATLAQTGRQTQEAIERLLKERDAHRRQRRADDAELHRVTREPENDAQLARIADIQQRLSATEQRITAIDAKLEDLTEMVIAPDDVAAALADFDAVWRALTPRKQSRILHLLIERISYDGQQGNLSLTFHSTGIKALAAELVDVEEHAA